MPFGSKLGTDPRTAGPGPAYLPGDGGRTVGVAMGSTRPPPRAVPDMRRSRPSSAGNPFFNAYFQAKDSPSMLEHREVAERPGGAMTKSRAPSSRTVGPGPGAYYVRPSSRGPSATFSGGKSRMRLVGQKGPRRR